MALDCTKATSVVERAICAVPPLMEQDAALSKAYADRLAQNPAGATALRTDQRAWLAQRDRLCGTAAATPPRVTACLTGLYRARLVALAAGASPAPQGTATSIPATTPAAAVLSAPPAPTLPDLPTRRPDPDAVLARSSVPADGPTDVLLDVRVPGRFSVRAKSASGVALQLVDMIAGPGDQKGDPGIKDGRIDVLLDRGTYKLRTFGATGANGEAQLTVQPFRETVAATNALAFGGEAAATLSDLGQRSFWIAIDKPGHVSVEAVGRALGDLRLWRNGTDLSALDPVIDRVTPKAGHPMTRARIDGDVEPGLYLATAYGRPKLVWTDGSSAEPLHLRAGDPEPLTGGWIEGVIGARGSARFAAPDHASLFRLDLPEPAVATLSVRQGTGDPLLATIAKNSREPEADVESHATTGRLVEVTGSEGQPFRLRALDPAASRDIAGAGPTWIGVDVAGEGGDEMPATVVLAQVQGNRGDRVLASSTPQIGPAKGWRRRFNLRGKTTLLFEVTATIQTSVTMTGVRATPAITPLLGAKQPRADGKVPRWTLDPGWYVLTLAPVGEAVGVVDVTLGPPGLAVEADTQPARPSISLGSQTLVRGVSYRILANDTPTLRLAPFARALPADLQDGPLTLQQDAGQTLDIPVRTPLHGFLAASGVNGVPIAVQRDTPAPAKDAQTSLLHIPAPERPRGLVLSWSDPAARNTDLLRLPATADLEAVEAGRPRFFDLGRGETKSFALNVPEGGLYRVETLGRLQTSLTVATAFLPTLDAASANGAGENALTQSFLRAGRYNVGVKASDSSGRVGLVARAAALPEGSRLVDGGSARARLADGRGAMFPIVIAEAGRYRLDLYALGTPLRARLEDQDGWPLTVPGPTTAIERRFEVGHYRLVVLPEPVEARAVARLTQLVQPVPLAGHGPHPLPFDRPAAFQWREPASAAETRAPDRWTFALQGPADITLDLSSGMAGTLLREGEDHALARIVAKSGFAGKLEAGHYVLEAQSLGRNDRLDYTVALVSAALQPGVPRRILLPATVPFALAEDRVVNLTSFGRIDLRGVLKDAAGQVIERVDDRTDDWNIALSRRLPAGSYTLELSSADPRPAKTDEAKPDDADQPSADSAPDQPDEAEADTPDADQPDADHGAAADTPDDADQPAEPDKATPDTADATEPDEVPAKPADKAETASDDPGIELMLALPDTTEGGAARRSR